MKNYCADIHNNLTISLTRNGIKLGACCWDKSTKVPSDLANLWNASNLTRLRELNKLDQLDSYACKQCIYMEQNGGSSRRTGVNEYYKIQETDLSGPRGLEITIDFTCNIACVYCSPELSTQWRLELNTPKKQFPIRLAQPDIIALLDTLDLSNLNNIHFYGGDPLFTNTHEVILNYIDKQVGLDKIYAWYNTNGTLRVNDRVQELWSRCRLVKVFFSIDDIGPRFEYIRYGATWNEVEDNMLWYKDTMPSNVMFTIQPTVSCLSALHHYELLDWKKQYFDTNKEGDLTDINRHNVFNKFELTSMPQELLDKVLVNNSQDSWFVDFVKSFKFNPIQRENTRRLIAELDQRRGCDFSATFPDLVPYFVQ
jgi:sulfatase maturation enzyme AslB (radical SAM superfamily)